MALSRGIAWVVVFGLTGAACGQPVSWLRLAEGEGAGERLVVVEIDATSGAEGAATPALDRSSWVYGLGDHGSHNYTAAMTPEDLAGLDPGELLAGSQAVLFGADLHERVVVMPAEEFGLLAGRSGLDWAPPAGVATVRVRRIEAARVLVRESRRGAMWASPIATAKRGERAEIRLLMDPTVLTPETIVPVRAYVEGDAAKGATVIATHVESGASGRYGTDDKGIAIVTLDRPGAWRLEFHVARPAGGAEAEWTVYSATLGFEVLGGAR